MLIRQGDARNSVIDRRLASVLAAVAGAINAAGFHAVGFFSANMTGNVSSLSDHIAFGDLVLAGAYLGIFVTFISGAMVSTLLINAGRRRRIERIYAFSILLEAILLGCLGAVDLWLPAGHRGPVLIIGLSFLMGLQNAVVTRISNARVRTTHVSGMSTDIGIELGILADMARGREPETDKSDILAKLRLHGQTVLFFVAGGVFGVAVYREVGGMLLLACSALLLMLALPAVRHRTPQPA
jgi:uncharacterized membrane protein YoaK (UPF0700 family)